jgi:hypothetical protein
VRSRHSAWCRPMADMYYPAMDGESGGIQLLCRYSRSTAGDGSLGSVRRGQPLRDEPGAGFSVKGGPLLRSAGKIGEMRLPLSGAVHFLSMKEEQ